VRLALQGEGAGVVSAPPTYDVVTSWPGASPDVLSAAWSQAASGGGGTGGEVRVLLRRRAAVGAPLALVAAVDADPGSLPAGRPTLAYSNAAAGAANASFVTLLPAATPPAGSAATLVLALNLTTLGGRGRRAT
jgi:hypothetical protein